MPKAFINESNAKYQRLFKLYKQAYPDKRGDAVTDEVVKGEVNPIFFIPPLGQNWAN